MPQVVPQLLRRAVRVEVIWDEGGLGGHVHSDPSGEAGDFLDDARNCRRSKGASFPSQPFANLVVGRSPSRSDVDVVYVVLDLVGVHNPFSHNSERMKERCFGYVRGNRRPTKMSMSEAT